MPQRALLRDAKGNPTTYVVNAENKVEIRPLKVGRTQGNSWVVLDGLKAGDKVIVEGLQKIRPGSPVRIAEPTPVKQVEMCIRDRYLGRENHVTAFNPNGLARILFLVMAAAFLSEKTKPFPAHRKRALFYGERSRSKTEKPL